MSPFPFVAAGSLACRPSVQIYPIILTIVIFVTVIPVLKSYNKSNNSQALSSCLMLNDDLNTKPYFALYNAVGAKVILIQSRGSLGTRLFLSPILCNASYNVY